MLPIRARRIGMIHDLNVFDHPLENRLRSALIDRLTHASLARRADVILTVSEFSRQRILNQWRLPADRVKVVYCGVSSNFQDGCSGCRQHAAVRDKYGIGGEYFLWYGTMGKRKNVPALIRAFHEFRRRTGSSALVVLAGTSGNDSANVQRLIASFQLEQAVRNLGYVPDAELYTLLKGAIALVFPSLYEGFGLPVLEAMACGTPVIAANRTSLPEVIGGAGLLVDPLDTTSMARAMDALEEHLDLRRELSGRGKAQAAGFTWRNTAERLLTIFGAASSA